MKHSLLELVRYMTRSRAEPTPGIVKLAVAALALAYTMPVVDLAVVLGSSPLVVLLQVLAALVAMAFFVGLWNMKRWAAKGLLIVPLVLALLVAGRGLTSVLSALARALPLVPVAVLWRRFDAELAPSPDVRGVLKTAGLVLLWSSVACAVLIGIFTAIWAFLKPV